MLDSQDKLIRLDYFMLSLKLKPSKKLLPFLFFFSLLFSTQYSAANSPDSSDQTPIKSEVNIIKSHAIAMRGEPKYKEDFKHWDYVNPNAPKGGTIKTATQGTFDNFNRYAQRGSAPAGIDGLFDSLMVANHDEIQVLYGLIAEQIEYPTDYSWVVFHLNPKATFQDGKSIRAQDVAFSFNLFYTQGVPQFRKYYEGVTVEVIDDKVVKFNIPQKQKSLLFNLAGNTILPEHFYQGKAFSEPFNEPPLGSGAYEITDFKMGKYVTYQINDKYWARNHPVNLGRMNFKTETVEYYLDETVLFEAFKKGEYDFRVENVAKNWETSYTGTHFDNGNIIKEEINHHIPTGNQAFVFNIKRPPFDDVRVRKALNLLFDFEWTNKNFFYNSYKRNNSYFINTNYASSGIPEGEELVVLNQFKDQLPSELFTQAFSLNQTDGTGQIRNEIRSALKLLNQAGYQLKNKQLVDSSGKQLVFEVLLYSSSMERIVIPFQKNVERIGAKLNIKLLSDSSQYINRLRERDFDMVISQLARGGLPTAGLKQEWHSDFLDSTYNSVGTQDKMIDFFVEKIAKVELDDKQLIPYARAFDRILLWRYYTIPQWHLSKFRIAHWNKFSRPASIPKYDLGMDAWWYDESKASKLKP